MPLSCTLKNDENGKFYVYIIYHNFLIKKNFFKQRRLQINELSMHLKKLEEQQPKELKTKE